MLGLEGVKEGDALLIAYTTSSPARDRITRVSRVLKRYVETTDGQKWRIDNGTRWGSSSRGFGCWRARFADADDIARVKLESAWARIDMATRDGALRAKVPPEQVLAFAAALREAGDE